MAKRPQNSIPMLSSKILASGEIKWHWKPSPRLRRAGWSSLDCGTDKHIAFNMAMERNKEIEMWELGLHSGSGIIAEKPKALARSMAELIHDYKKHDNFIGLKAKTQGTYLVQLKKILVWTDNGAIPVAHITRQTVLQLRNSLSNNGKMRVADGNLLRVLRLLMQFAVDEGILSINPAAKIKIPGATPRTHIILPEAVELLIDTANRYDMPSIAMAISLGFWTMQRESDLLAYNRSDWIALNAQNAPSHVRAALINKDATIKAFRKRQEKTGEYVDAPVPPDISEKVDSLIHNNSKRHIPTLPILADDTASRKYPQRLFQKRFAKIRNMAWARAMQDRNWRLAKHVRNSQFRDLRRTGMCYYAEMEVPIPWIAAISGHSINYTQKILDTYLPHNSRFAILGVAEAIIRASAITNSDKNVERSTIDASNG